jgi:hypothetical protein
MSAFLLKLKSLLRRVLVGTRCYKLYSGYRHCNIGFSQFGEDIHVKSFYDRLKFLKKINVKTGMVVDIASFRPVAYSNSYFFTNEAGKASISIPLPNQSAFLIGRGRVTLIWRGL